VVTFTEYLAQEWKPALGCTEPASVAYAAATAAALASGDVLDVRLICDPRIYKNCYAVGIPHSEHKVGLRWALAIGSLLPDPSLKLECFRGIDARTLERAQALLDRNAVHIDVDTVKDALFIDVRVRRASGEGRACIEREHTQLTRLEKDGAARPVQSEREHAGPTRDLRDEVARLSFAELVEMARAISDDDRVLLARGVTLNLAIAQHGLGLFPRRFVEMSADDSLSRISRLVCAGVYARMWGEDFTVMSLAGSGNKGIVCAVPLALWGEELKRSTRVVEEALALACLVTSATTHHLGALSAVCGCSNAAGIGLAAGLIYLEGGGAEGVSLAVNNMVGNITGMICDGAKIGCALKTMTSVDAAFRSASLALSGIAIPFSDGIVGADGIESLRNLGSIARRGMSATDAEILRIMQDKLRGPQCNGSAHHSTQRHEDTKTQRRLD
jgi:L-cysteine desulfidase